MQTELCKRMQEYRLERRQFFLKDFPIIALIGFIVIFGLSFLLANYLNVNLIADWKLVASALWICALVLPLQMMYPEKPSSELVEYDRVLNEIGSISKRNI